MPAHDDADFDAWSVLDDLTLPEEPSEKVLKVEPGLNNDGAGDVSATSLDNSNVDPVPEEEPKHPDLANTNDDEPGSGSTSSPKIKESDSDSEDERQQCVQILENMDALVASETAREEERAASSDTRPSHTRLELLLMVRKLMQMHVKGENDEAAEELSRVNKEAASEEEADKHMKFGVKEVLPSDDKGADSAKSLEDEPLVPQAREFRNSNGYQSFDEVRDGKTLVHLCCAESAKRNPNCPSIRSACDAKLTSLERT